MAVEGVAHRVREHRAATEGDDRVGFHAIEQVADHALLLGSELGLAVAREELLDARAQALLERRVGIHRADAELGRDGAGRRRLARAHEADEDERAQRGPPPRGFQPMRCS
jgi:hypothetical protein